MRQGDAGNYAEFLESLQSTPIGRRQLLVLNYHDALANSSTVATSVRLITQHYGVAIVGRASLPRASRPSPSP